MINHIEGLWSLEETLEFLARDTRRYAKRQYTWFNKMKDIEWYQPSSITPMFERINRWLG